MNVLAFDFFFVAPLTFAVADLQYVVTFVVMLLVARHREPGSQRKGPDTCCRRRERRTALLYAMSRELAAADSARTCSGRHHTWRKLSRARGRAVADPQDACTIHAVRRWGSLRGADLSVRNGLRSARLAWTWHGHAPAAVAQYQPLRGTSRTLGVLAVHPTQRRRLLLPEQQHLLETFAGQIGLAIERANLAEEAEAALVAAETESLRNTLLASISHDLRTPLAVIAGASSTQRSAAQH
jgi:two-component system sensor histidine kinase KdpD